MKITSMQKMIAVVGAFLIVAAIGFVIVVLPMFQQLDTLAAEKVTAQQQLQQAQTLLAQLEQAKARSAVTEAKLLKIGTEMPDSPQLPTLIMELQDVANQSGVSVTSFSPAQPSVVTGGKFTEISMTTQLTTKWDDLLDYLTRLGKSTRLLRVTNVTINPSASNSTTITAGQDVDLTVSLTTKAYVIGTNGQIAAANTTTTPTGTP